VAAGSDHPLLGSRRPIKNVVPPATRLSSPTSATKSAQSGHPSCVQRRPLSEAKPTFKLTRPRLKASPRRRSAPEHGLIAEARQQIFWKRARQRGTLIGGSR
jgi:hypothetical protein